MPVSRNIDLDRPRIADEPADFALAGHTFRLRQRIRATAFAEYHAMTGDESYPQTVGILDRAIRASIVPEQHAEWEAAMQADGDEEAIDIADLVNVMPWLMQQAYRRPLDRLSSSIGGDESTETSLAETSSGAPAGGSPETSTAANGSALSQPPSTSSPISTGSSPTPTGITHGPTQSGGPEGSVPHHPA